MPSDPTSPASPEIEATHHTLSVPGVDLVYDVRGVIAADTVPLMLIGCPMDAAGFPTLASHFPDRTVVTYDPRGIGRSKRTDVQRESTARQHADDVHAIIGDLGVETVDLFASSGGATNALGLIASYPDDVRTLVAHESPAIQVLPDRDAAQAVVDDLGETYQQRGFNHAMAKFISIVSHEGEFTGPMPDADPAQLGMPDTDDGSRDDPLFFQNARSLYAFEPDYEALRAAPARLVLGVGQETGQQLTARTMHVMSAELGIPVTMFPSGHAGFLGGEYGQQGEPEAFAARLRERLGSA